MNRINKTKFDKVVMIVAAVAIAAVAVAFVVSGVIRLPTTGGCQTCTARSTTTLPPTTSPTTTLPSGTEGGTGAGAITTTTLTENTCAGLCMSAGYAVGTCRPACLSYEKRSSATGSDCTELQKCCCKL